MEEYIGVKLVEAQSALREIGASNSGNGSETERVLAYGYKVKYEDGYESWSPKDAFEKAYRKINLSIPIISKDLQDYQFRVIVEANELLEKIVKLDTFINSNSGFRKLSIDEQNILKQQLLTMKYYLTILIERINNFNL